MRLTPRQVDVLRQIAAGLTHTDAARVLRMTRGTLNNHLSDIRHKFQCGATPVMVHIALLTRQIKAPTTTKCAPRLDREELALLRAIAHGSDPADIALASGVTPADVQDKADALVAKAGAANRPHLIALAHAWRLPGISTPAPHRTSQDHR